MKTMTVLALTMLALTMLALTGERGRMPGRVERRLVGFGERDAAILAAIDAKLRQTADARNGPLQMHGFGAARAGRSRMPIHDGSMTREGPAALT